MVGHERGLMELADWCDATVAMVEGRKDHLEVAALAAAVPFWSLQSRVSEICPAVDRMAPIAADPEHHLALRHCAV